MSEALIEGAFHVLAWNNLLLVCLGTALGIVFGAILGLTATMGRALLVPFTFSMDPAGGLLMLAGIYVGAMYGDAIPAILINTPGTPAAIATTFDGFPLARKGMAQHALVTAAFASFVGSVLANIVLATSAGPLAEMSLKFGPPSTSGWGSSDSRSSRCCRAATSSRASSPPQSACCSRPWAWPRSPAMSG